LASSLFKAIPGKAIARAFEGQSRADLAPPEFLVMPALVAGIHALLFLDVVKTWMAGTSPGHDEPGKAHFSISSGSSYDLRPPGRKK
jgi:hypothetical protein